MGSFVSLCSLFSPEGFFCTVLVPVKMPHSALSIMFSSPLFIPTIIYFLIRNAIVSSVFFAEILSFLLFCKFSKSSFVRILKSAVSVLLFPSFTLALSWSKKRFLTWMCFQYYAMNSGSYSNSHLSQFILTLANGRLKRKGPVATGPLFYKGAKDKESSVYFSEWWVSIIWGDPGQSKLTHLCLNIVSIGWNLKLWHPDLLEPTIVYLMHFSDWLLIYLMV